MDCWCSSGKRHIPKKHGHRRCFVEKQQQETLEIVKDFECDAKNIGNLRRRFHMFDFLIFPCFPFFSFSCFMFSHFPFFDFYRLCFLFFLFFFFRFVFSFKFFQASEGKIVEKFISFLKIRFFWASVQGDLAAFIFSLFFLFSVRADAKTGRNCRKVPIVKNVDFPV